MLGKLQKKKKTAKLRRNISQYLKYALKMLKTTGLKMAESETLLYCRKICLINERLLIGSINHKQ